MEHQWPPKAKRSLPIKDNKRLTIKVFKGSKAWREEEKNRREKEGEESELQGG